MSVQTAQERFTKKAVITTKDRDAGNRVSRTLRAIAQNIWKDKTATCSWAKKALNRKSLIGGTNEFLAQSELRSMNRKEMKGKEVIFLDRSDAVYE